MEWLRSDAVESAYIRTNNNLEYPNFEVKQPNLTQADFDTIEGFVEMTILDISAIPESLRDYDIEYLEIVSDNGRIPQVLSTLPMRGVSIEHVTEIHPEDVKHIRGIRELTIQGDLDYIPIGFLSELPELELLDLGHTKIMRLPEDIQELMELHSLFLPSTMTTLPLWIQELGIQMFDWNYPENGWVDNRLREWFDQLLESEENDFTSWAQNHEYRPDFLHRFRNHEPGGLTKSAVKGRGHHEFTEIGCSVM